jgi:hypothetical protein
VATRRNAPHTSAGTAKRSSPASISSNHRPDRRVVGVVGALQPTAARRRRKSWCA